MTYTDDRTEDQKKSHHILITATDKFMSGWGGASGGTSKCAWACKDHAQADKIYEWVKNRSEMKYVNIHYRNEWKPRNYAHLHIYVVDENHPALR